MKNFTKINKWGCPKCEGFLQQMGGSFNTRDSQLLIVCQDSDCDFKAYLLVPDNPEKIRYEVKTVPYEN